MISNCVRALLNMIAFLAGMTLGADFQAALADGGRLIRVERIDGFQISVFVAPNPPRVGPIDVSILLQEEASGDLVADADMAVMLYPSAEPHRAVSGPATSAQATNKLLRSAILVLPTVGRWEGTVNCATGGRNVSIPLTIDVAPAPGSWPSLAPWFLWPLGVAAIFGAHRFLKSRRDSTRRA